MADYCYIKMRITGEERNLKILKEKSTSLKKAYKSTPAIGKIRIA